MSEEGNLRLDVDSTKRGGAPVARICVGFARGYTRDGEPTLTLDCESVEALEREVERLHDELKAGIREAAKQLEDCELAAESAGAAEGAADTADGPHIDSELKVADLMTSNVRTLGRNDKLSVAEELMRVGNFRHAVIVDEEGALAGVLSQRDIVLSALTWQLGQGRSAHDRALESTVAKDLMQTQVVTIAPDAPIAEAAGKMNEHKVGCLPVMDGPKLVGIITEGDFLALVAG